MIKIEKISLLKIQDIVKNLAGALKCDNTKTIPLELISIEILRKLFVATHEITDIEQTRASFIAESIIEANLVCGCDECRSKIEVVSKTIN